MPKGIEISFGGNLYELDKDTTGRLGVVRGAVRTYDRNAEVLC